MTTSKKSRPSGVRLPTLIRKGDAVRASLIKLLNIYHNKAIKTNNANWTEFHTELKVLSNTRTNDPMIIVAQKLAQAAQLVSRASATPSPISMHYAAEILTKLNIELQNGFNTPGTTPATVMKAWQNFDNAIKTTSSLSNTKPSTPAPTKPTGTAPKAATPAPAVTPKSKHVMQQITSLISTHAPKGIVIASGWRKPQDTLSEEKLYALADSYINDTLTRALNKGNAYPFHNLRKDTMGSQGIMQALNAGKLTHTSDIQNQSRKLGEIIGKRLTELGYSFLD